MANNIIVGPNAIVAKATVSFATAGITALNSDIIYLVGNPLKSYVPGRAINGISGFETGKGYYMVAKTVQDLEAIVVPPLDSAPAPGTWTDLDFTTISPANAIVESSSGVWVAGSGAVVGYGNLGLAAVKFPAGVDGAIITQFPTVTAEKDAIFGIADTNAVSAYSAMEYGFWNGAGSGTISTTSGGPAPGTVSAGDWYGIFRTGSTFKLRKSPDKTNWTDLATASFSSAGIVYVVTDIHSAGLLKNPQYQGLI